jgi:hypothetical protein
VRSARAAGLMSPPTRECSSQGPFHEVGDGDLLEVFDGGEPTGHSSDVRPVGANRLPERFRRAGNLELQKEALVDNFELTDKVLKVESKDKIKVRLGASPDIVDSVVLGLYVALRKEPVGFRVRTPDDD